MKGMVFTTFLEMVEEKFSVRMVDYMIETSDLPSGGSYTTVGTYGHGELIQLVVRLSEKSGIPVSDLVRTFGEYLFGQLVEMHPEFLKTAPTVFDMLKSVDKYIHVEVRKLYADAELPGFEYEMPLPGTLILTYRSSRPFADLAEGLLIGCARHYGENIRMEREDLTDGGTAAKFTLTKED
ncbi:heme NO-binding domain-containing protein [Paenibacillus hodogayensis]|uniref:Heme NO-binding domain-containing protein n=1 Tax=Paenibacillus hodogayensis TaxID=279208 RepID=A0ABV5VUW8_9BACL